MVAEALSRVCLRESPTSSCGGPRIEVDMIIQHLPATHAKLQEIRDATNENITISHHKNVIYHEWSKHRRTALTISMSIIRAFVRLSAWRGTCSEGTSSSNLRKVLSSNALAHSPASLRDRVMSSES